MYIKKITMQIQSIIIHNILTLLRFNNISPQNFLYAFIILSFYIKTSSRLDFENDFIRKSYQPNMLIALNTHFFNSSVINIASPKLKNLYFSFTATSYA